MINIGVGLYWGTKKIVSKINNIIKTFKSRVFANNGLYEAETCQIAILNNLNNI